MSKMSKFDVITVGTKIGRWTVLEKDVENPNSHMKRKVRWAKCQCECGTIRYKRIYDLYNKKSLSCGCLRNELTAKRNHENGKKIEIGARFGKLTMIQDLGFRKQKSRDKMECWSLCKCDCGSIVEVSNNNLKTGGTKSCGCTSSRGEEAIKQILKEHNINFAQQYIFKDLVGEKNGKLRFDFAIFKENKLYCLLEFQGRQHFVGPDAAWSRSDSLETIQYRDNLKKEYCEKHNYPLFYIDYTEMGKISWDFLKERMSL